MASCALANCSLAVWSSKLAYSGALLLLACCTASSACDICDTVAAGGLPAQLLSPTAPQSRSNCMTAFLLVIGYPFFSEPSFYAAIRRLMAYLFFVRKTVVSPACLEDLSSAYGRHHPGSAIFMPRFHRMPGPPQTLSTAPSVCTGPGAYGI